MASVGTNFIFQTMLVRSTDNKELPDHNCVFKATGLTTQVESLVSQEVLQPTAISSSHSFKLGEPETNQMD